MDFLLVYYTKCLVCKTSNVLFMTDCIEGCVMDSLLSGGAVKRYNFRLDFISTSAQKVNLYSSNATKDQEGMLHRSGLTVAASLLPLDRCSGTCPPDLP